MATRKNTFLVRRSNIAGNVPTAGQLLLGELALNTADVKLYTSGTTTNSILPIGWDRISRTGDTMTGSFSAPTISATTYYNLPTDVFVTGGTVQGSSATFINNTGGTFTVTGFGSGNSSGLTASDYVVQGKLNSDQSIPINTDTVIQFIYDFDPQNWLNSTNYRFTPTIAGYYNITVEVLFSNGSVSNNQYNTQMRKNGNQIAIFQNQITTSVGVSQGNSRIVYLNGTTDYVDFTVYNGNSGAVNLSKGSSDSSGTYFSASLLVGGTLIFTGGTISGPANAISGFSANTISATTYYNLPTDIYTTGGTYSNGTAVFTNNTGGTFNITGFSTPFTGGTVTGATTFTNGLVSNTISATTYYNLPTDVRVTGGTYSNGTAIFTNNTGGTFNVVGLTTPFTGGTVTGATIFTSTVSVSGNASLNGGISSTSLSGTTDRIVQVSSGGTISASIPIITAYLTSGGTVANLLETTSNWDINGVYTGTTITGTYQGQKHYNGDYLFEAVADNLFIRLIRG